MTRYDLMFIIFGIEEHSNIIPQNIFEIGSRDGHDANFLSSHFKLPHNSCYIFEANPKSAESIMITYPEMNLFNNAVNDISGKLTFNIEPQNVGASSLLKRRNPCDEIKSINVDGVTMEDVIETLNIKTIDICKIDVEGATLNVLKSFGKHLNKLQSIQIESELKEVWEKQDLYDNIKIWLMNNGFVEILFVSLRQVQSDSFWLKKGRELL